MPASDGARPSLPQRMRTRMRAAATERLALKLAALFFACVLWLVVSAEEPTEQVVQIAVAPRLDSSLVLIGRRPVVRALVVGRARELLELAADPPVARPVVDGASFDGDSAEVDIQPRDIEVPTNVQVFVREIRPRTVTIQVARVSRPLPPATEAESALAGLVAPRMQIDTARALRDVVLPLDSLAPGDTAALDTAAARTGVPATRRDSARVDSARRVDSVRRDSVRRDSLRRRDAGGRGRRP